MALAARIKSVSYTQQAQGESGPQTVDLSLSGQLVVVADYIDTADSQKVILSQTFQVPATETVQQIQDRILTFGRRVRDARVRTGELTAFVGAVVEL